MLPSLLLPLLASVALAPQDPPAPAPQPEPRPATPPEVVFAFDFAGPDSLFVSEKDAGLLRALRLLDERMNDLPGEVPDFPVPPPVIELLTGLMGGSLGVTLALDDMPVPGLPLPLMAELRLGQGDADDAREAAFELADFLTTMGLPLREPPPDRLWQLPVPVPVYMGAEGQGLVVRLGGEAPLPERAMRDLLPEGTTHAHSGWLDYGRILRLALSAVPQGADSPELEQVLEALRSTGLDTMRYAWASGSDAERQYSHFVMPGWAAQMRASGLLPERPLQREFCRVVPADATWATVFALDVGATLRYYRQLAALSAEGVDLFARIEEETGLSVERDLIAPFGGQSAIYASDSTGGGGMMSIVVVMELADSEAFLGTWAHLEQALDRLGSEMARGYVRTALREEGGVAYRSIEFPGLPVPLELTLGTTPHYAVLGLTPQATRAAVAQLAGGRPSLLDDPDFAAQVPASLEGCTSVAWIDTPRLMRDGYGLLSLGCSAIANAMRSPADPARDPGIVLPSYGELAQGARGIVAVSRVRGEDVVSEVRSDRSHLVNAAGIVGFLQSSPLLALVAAGATAGAVVPQVTQQLEQAQYARSRADVARIQAALHAFAANNGGHYPDTLEVLVTPDANGATYLPSRDALIDPWGLPYVYEPPTEADPEPYVYSEAIGE